MIPNVEDVNKLCPLFNDGEVIIKNNFVVICRYLVNVKLYIPVGPSIPLLVIN